MQGRERTERNWGVGEVARVHVETQDLVDPRKTGGGTRHTVDCGREAVLVLVPWRCAREDKLNRDAENAQPSESPRKHWGGAGSGENKHH